ncbi:MAG: MmcQ/YjbR family DNA-binding protein [Actinomycetota bacterium]|nr:MmcQ/YjbR family DNA-binding protein [Actinomycetota bacterium]
MAATTDPDPLLGRVRAMCLALPETTEKLSHGSPTFFVRKTFLTWVDDHHGDGNVGFWCAAPPGEQAGILAADPERFFRPPYVGHRGWIGVRLVVADGSAPDWDEIAELVEDAYRTVAPARLVQALDER